MNGWSRRRWNSSGVRVIADIASLGISVESTQVEKASAALGKLATSGKTAETATKSVGAASSGMSQQMATAVASASRLNQQIVANEKAAKLSGYAMTNLSFQLNDIATQAALGVGPLQILAAQGGQIYQVLSTGPGGVGGSLRSLGEMLTGLVTPARAFGVALVAAGGSAAIAFNSALNATREIEIGLSGVGRASGTTAEQIRQISIATAESGQATVGAAREMALAYASTGKIAADVTEQALGLTKQLAASLGEDATDAAARLAKALADPARGIDDLNRRLGAFDDKTVQLVKSLVTQNRTQEAQREIMRGIESGLVSASVATTGWERQWDKLTGTMSIYWDKLGHNLERASGGGTITERYLTEVEKLRSLENRNPAMSWLIGTKDIEAEYRKIADIQKEMLRDQDKASDTDLTIRSKQLGDLARSISPTTAAVQKLRDEWTALANGLDSPGMAGKLGEEGLDTARKALAIQEQRLLFYKSTLDVAKEEAQFAGEAANARSASQRADVEFQQTRARLLREGDPDAQAKATLVSQRIMAEAAAEQNRYARDRALSDQENLDRSRMELALVGQTAVSAAGVRAQFDAMADAKRRANELGSVVTDDDVARAKRLRAESEGATAALIRAHAQQDLAFEQSQMGRSEREQSVYSRMQGLGLLTNGEISGSQNELIANQIRFNEVMRISQDSSKEFTSTFVKGLMDGQSATQSLADAMNRLASKFADMAIDSFASAAFKPFSQGVASGATGGGLFAGIFHEGGEVGAGRNPHRYVPSSMFAGAKRYHNGGVIGADEMPAILQKGERVIPRGGKASSGSVVNVVTNIDARGADQTAIAGLRQDLALRDAVFKQQVIGVVRQASQDGMI